MLRKFLMASLITAAALAAPTAASARGGHGGWHGGGHWHGGGWRGWSGPRFYGLYTYPSCWRTVRVWTRWGWQWRRVWVCG
jgi:hypothetical protein